ncbi:MULTISPECIES: ATP-binding protein [unclassified Mesorhizobium]|uniref:ATP-binding protein n=1 Tax=unclassified Mesorhizobium TaxID=325217 RepID=UPI0030142D9D
MHPLWLNGDDPRIELSGERRQVTALFYDIVGSTEMLERSDPEDFSNIVSVFHRTAMAIIQENNGYLHQELGDGGCSYFGYPMQFEDAAEKAVRAALALVERCGRPRKGREPGVKLRVGVATGMVVISADGREIIGTAPVLAARLQAEAHPNSIFVSDSTYQLTRGSFEYGFIKHAHLKGFSEPIPLWQVSGTRSGHDRFSISRRPEAPLQGRSAELGILRRAWSKACYGKGHSLAIVGDGGIGKSRLVAELRREISANNSGEERVLQCHLRFTNRPLHPLLNYLELLLGSEAWIERDATAFCDRLTAIGISVSKEVARPLVAFAAAKTRQATGYLQSSDKSARRFREQAIAAAAELLFVFADSKPQLLVFEDVHWADSMTWELIDRLGEGCRNRAMLIVATSRHLAARNDDRERFSTTVRLSGLTAGAMTDLLVSLWEGPLPAGLAQFILDKSDGVPLFAEELAMFLQRRAAAGTTAADWNNLLNKSGITSLNDLLSARLSDVGNTRRTAQLASVIGREFGMSFLTRLLGPEKAVDNTDAELTELVAHGILETKTSAQGTIYRFRHSLLQEAAYASLLRTDCRQMHTRIAGLLTGGESTGMAHELAAWHCAQAGMHLDAAAYATKAAEACMIRSAMSEADTLLTMAEEQLARVSKRQKKTELQLDVLELRGVVSAALSGEGSQQTRRIYERALSIYRKQGGGDPGRRFALYWGWWFTAPNVTAQRARAQTLLNDMGEAQDPEVRLQSFHCAWATNFNAAQHEFCLSCVAKGLELYDAGRALRNRTIYGGHDAKVCGLGEKALSLSFMDDLPGSERAIKACLSAAEETDHVGSLLHALYYAVVQGRCQGRHDDVLRLTNRMKDLADRHSMAASRAKADMFGGWAEALSGSFEAGIRRFHEGLGLQEKIGTDDNISIQLDMQSELLERAGLRAEALNALERGVAESVKGGQFFWLPELYRRRAKLRAADGANPAATRRDLKRAYDMAFKQGAFALAKRAQSDLRDLEAGSTAR